MSQPTRISPLAIDLGAANTGVYSAHYQAGCKLEEIQEQTGKVYQLEKSSYTLLMQDRTAKRHQRRGFDRRQMAKRLFRLIWERHFNLDWDKDTRSTIGFLLNRRGFSFLDEEYDKEILSDFPQDALKELPEDLQPELKKYRNENDSYDLDRALTEWSGQDRKIAKQFGEIKKEPDCIRKRQVVIERTKKLRAYCSRRIQKEAITESDKAKVKPAGLSKWIVDEWRQKDVKGLEGISTPDDIDMVDYLNKQGPEQAQAILNSIPDYRTEETEIKNSLWNFKVNFKEKNFDLEKARETGKPDERFFDDDHDRNPNIKTHLHHLAFALYKIKTELESGHRHRSKYFMEVEQVLENTNHTHGYLKAFCRQLQSGGFEGLTTAKLTWLIGHLSNLELKPLRKYFNDKRHKKSDFWEEKRLEKFFERWILREWRVGEKDRDKAEGKDFSYKQLRQKWKCRQGSVIDFWLETDPRFTIPPYQDNNNRHPPRCQSLILNPACLDSKYPQWCDWLKQLGDIPSVKDYLDDFESRLKKLKSGKGKSYFDDSGKGDFKNDSQRRSLAALDARLLQFILDRVKATDSLKLNEIYSQAKGYKQNNRDEKDPQEFRKALERAINTSVLPDGLKTQRNYTNDAIFEQGTFLHLVCRYYKQRQRAKDGRLFIHPEYRFRKGRGYEKTGRFDDANCLMTYCNHKPRQKKYQSLADLAGVLQLSPQKLREVVNCQDGQTEDENLILWILRNERIKPNCERADKEQKARRGRLKLDIRAVYGLIYHKRTNESPSSAEIKKILKESRVRDATKLHSFCERAKKLCLGLTKDLYDEKAQKRRGEDLERNPAAAVYLLAQIYNIAFTERSGNTSTCAVCSADNAQRMQIVDDQTGNVTAKAQRLPAIATRLIDGAVMRMARIVGGAIADDKWASIECELENGQPVHVPIITESNRFEFEPSKEEIVEGQRKNPRQGKALERTDDPAPFDQKEQRIKGAGHNICPYTGESVTENNGEIDHIIPRASSWGTLNDEANLICASRQGNKTKGNAEYSLSNLDGTYKRKQFGSKDDGEIEEWIIDQIGDGSDENFKFGPYRSFINLNEDEQRAFRHALYLVDNPCLRRKVIGAINNRNRALVNGTQRYFAEVLANQLYKKAKRIDKAHLLTFDYFGVEARSSSRGDGIYDLRKDYEKAAGNDIARFAKESGKAQDAYSHLIDAQLAFAVAADAHRDEGSLKLELDNAGLWPVDKETGEIVYESTIFKAIRVEPDDMRQETLDRRKPSERFSSHRSFTRDTFYAGHYLPVLLKEENNQVSARIGFDWKNSFELRDTPKSLQNLNGLLKEGLCRGMENQEIVCISSFRDLYEKLTAQNRFMQQVKKSGYCYLSINKKKLHECLLRDHNTKNGQPSSDLFDFCYKTLGYRTEKETISKREDLDCVINKDENFQIKKEKETISLPSKKEWIDCRKKWQAAEKTGQAFEEFLRSYFKSQQQHAHQKAGKVFSMPVVSKQGKFLIGRKSWDGKRTAQILNDSNSTGTNNKPAIPCRLADGSLSKKLAVWAQSENVVKLSGDEYQDGEIIDPSDWYCVDGEKIPLPLPEAIDGLWYRIDDSTRPSIKIRLAQDGEKLTANPLEHAICKYNKPKKDFCNEINEIFEKKIKPAKKGKVFVYKGGQYNSVMKTAFKTARCDNDSPQGEPLVYKPQKPTQNGEN